MVVRAVWKGSLKFGMVSCSVKLAGAVSENEKVRFRTLNRETRAPVRAEYHDDLTGEPVEAADQIKGYELSKNDFLMIEPDEIKALKVASSHVLDIDEFVDMGSVDKVFFDKPYYLLPADRLSVEPFAIIRDAMATKKAAALASIVLYQRERRVLIEPHGRGMTLTTLRNRNAVVPAASVFGDLKKVKVDADMAEIAELIIAKKTGSFDPSTFEDRYENALLDLIKAKQAGKALPKAKTAPRVKVTDLLETLKRSLRAEDGGAAKKTAKPARRPSEEAVQPPKRLSA